MNVDDYRKTYAAELEKAASEARRQVVGARRPSAPAGTTDFLTLASEGPAASLAVPQSISVAAPANLTGQIDLVRDSRASRGRRLKALRALQGATFLGDAFDRYRASYRDALRSVAVDPDPGLREEALELLAMDKDEFARDLLVAGLMGQRSPLVPAAKAIQLLAYDDHGVAVPLARDIVEGNHDEETVAEALRVLAADPSSIDLFMRLLKDPARSRSVRSMSAAGLRLLDPRRFMEEASQIVMDPGEDDEIRATCLGGLAFVRGRDMASPASDLATTAERLGLEASGPLRAAAKQFLRTRTSE